MTSAIRPGAFLFVLLFAAALLLRADTFGDPNLHGDEVFYHTVGIAMHHGALPYVDVWDRKPFGLFAIYWLIAGISAAPIAYQLAATLAAAGTAWAIAAIARGWTGAQGGLLAGAIYLLCLDPLQCFGGQSPVFYNLFIALAALLTFRALPSLREGRAPRTLPLAMLIAGLGITIKTTAFFEAAFLGLYSAAVLWRSPAATPATLRAAAGWMAIGAAPALAIALVYALLGHWAEYWHAMVTSNLIKTPDWPTSWARLKIMALVLAPLIALAAAGLARLPGEGRRFVIGWIVAAMVGLFANPNFYLHYGAPLAVPLCVAAAAFLGRGRTGVAVTGVLALLSLTAAPLKFGHAAQSQRALAKLENVVKTHRGNGPLFLYDAPPQLYVETGQPFVTPLVFPTHLSHGIEKDVSHLSTLGETRRVLALRPGAVVMAVPIRNGPVNEETHRLVLAYVGTHCRLVKVVPTPEWLRTDMIAVWGNCR